MNKITLNINKKKAQIMSKIGRLEITQDTEYDTLLSMHQNHKKQVQETIKQFKNVSDNFISLSASLAQLVQSIQNTYQQNDPIHPYIEKMAHQLEIFDENYVQKFQKEIQFSCVDAIMNFFVSLDGPKQSIHQRDKSKIEYDEKRTQLNKLLDSKKPNIQQKIILAREKLQFAESNYQNSRFNAKKEMAALLNEHGTNFDPPLIAFQNSICSLAHGMEKTIGQLGEIAEDLELHPLNREKIEIINKPLEDDEVYEDSEGLSELSSGPSSNIANSSISTSYDNYKGDALESNYIPNSQTNILPQQNIQNNELDLFFDEFPKNDNNISQSQPIHSSSLFPEEFDTDWYYLNDDLTQLGPVPIPELALLFKNGQITGSTLVFGGDMTDWLELFQVPRLRLLFEEFCTNYEFYKSINYI